MNTSTLRLLATRTAILGLAVASVGCTTKQRFVEADQQQEPPVLGASTLRTWEPVVYEYPSGDAIAGSTGFRYEPKRDEDGWTYYFADTGTFLGNFFTMPITLLQEPGEVRYEGLRFEPTQTFMPELPPSPTAAAQPAPDRPVTVPVIEPLPTPMLPEAPTEESPVEVMPVDETPIENPVEGDPTVPVPAEPTPTPVEPAPVSPGN